MHTLYLSATKLKMFIFHIYFCSVSLDRGRHTFEERERQLMAEVRGLRRQLASDNRRQHPPPEYTLY